MNTLAKRIDSVGIGKDRLFIELSDGTILVIPKDYTPRLQKARLLELLDYELIGGGVGIHFPKIDEDISLEGLIRDFAKE